MPYIEAGHQKALKEFKYKGTCASITYKYLWSPFAQFLLKFVPQNIAPNVITLVAFAIIIISHILFLYEGDSTFTKSVEPWKYILFGVSLFLYQHLDNLDGKQARKTKNSSPIGMLFDHGCDAISSMLLGLTVVKLIQCQHTQVAFYALVFIIMIPNYLIVWVQYGTGAFHFDQINPIDEGLPCYQLLGLLGYFFDYSFWKEHHWITSYNYQFLLGLGIIVVIVCFKMTKNVLKQTTREKKDMLATLWLPLILAALIATNKLTGLEKLVYHEYLYVYFYIITFWWGRNEIYLQICSVAEQKFNPFNWGTIAFVVSMIVLFLFPKNNQYFLTYLYVCLAIQALFLIELVVSFLKQSSSILNIKLFSVNKVEPTKTQ